MLAAGTVGLLAAYSALLRGAGEIYVTHHGTLNDAPGFYDSFDRRADGAVRAVLNPSCGDEVTGRSRLAD